MAKYQVKLNSKHQRVDATLEELNGRIYLGFGYDNYLKDEIKAQMNGTKFDWDSKRWHFPKVRRNMFRLALLLGKNPYQQYDQEIRHFETLRKGILRPHQQHLFDIVKTYREVVLAAEMGTGKTLVGIEVIDTSDFDEWWWVGPIPALAAFEQEVRKWGITKMPRVMTYERMVKEITNWSSGFPAPRGVVFDESSRLKGPTSQRTQHAQHLVEYMRKDHKDQGRDIYVVEMTGTPAPKSPTDWYSQLEIAQPGFIKEGDHHKFKERLAIVEDRPNTTTGGTYPHMLGWRDSEDKCGQCGQLKDTAIHDEMFMDPKYHPFIPSENEIAKLPARMKGLVHVLFKRDVLKDLPEKQYRILQCKPTVPIRNAEKLIRGTIKNAAQQLIALRELSDGFLYESVESGERECAVCNGTKVAKIPQYEGEDVPGVTTDEVLGWEEVECFNCGGTGLVPVFSRSVKEVTTGKDELLLDIFGDHEDDGRLVVYGGFTGTLERLKKLSSKAGWYYICADGRGWRHNIPDKRLKKSEMLDLFQDPRNTDKIVFIGQPGAAGMGITLTRSSEIVYYSNDFNGESRIQSEDRIHRMGMDLNKGALITDLVQLASDLYVIDNLREKRRLQDITLGDLEANLRKYEMRAA